MIVAAVGLIELYRRDLLRDLIGSLKEPKRRPFAHPAAQPDAFLGPVLVP